MNKFIEVTNRIIAEKLKDKIHISSIYYSVWDGIFTIDVKYYTDEFDSLGFRFRYNFCGILNDMEKLEWDFELFINREFNL